MPGEARDVAVSRFLNIKDGVVPGRGGVLAGSVCPIGVGNGVCNAGVTQV